MQLSLSELLCRFYSGWPQISGQLATELVKNNLCSLIQNYACK